MKIILCLILFIHICFCLTHSEESESNSRQVYYDGISDGHQQRRLIQRPCSLNDLNCIRRYFAYNSRCYPVLGPAPDPYRMQTLPLQLANANITFTRNDVQIKGLNNFKINEFYVNKFTDRLVLEVEFQSLVVTGSATVITYYRKGLEPIELTDYSIIDYRSVSLTMTIPNLNDIQLSNAMVYSYLNDAAPQFRVGPAFTESKDPIVTSRMSQMSNNISISLRESFITQGPVFMSVFMQSIICDFGLREIRI